MLAILIQVSALAMEASKSLARRRLRLSQASVRSTTQRRGRICKPCAGRPPDDRERPVAEMGECRRELVAGVAAIGKDMTQPRERAACGP